MRLLVAIPLLGACARPAPVACAPAPAAPANVAPAPAPAPAVAPPDVDDTERVMEALVAREPHALRQAFEPATGYIVVDAFGAGHAEVPIAAEHLCGKGARAYLGEVEATAHRALDDGARGVACAGTDRFVECSFTEPLHDGARYTFDFVAAGPRREPRLARIRIDEPMGPTWDDARAVADQARPEPCTTQDAIPRPG